MIERKLTGRKPVINLPNGTIDTQMHMYLPGFPAQEGGPPLPPGLPGPDEYRQVMDWLGIDRVVITQGNAHQFDNGNLVAALREMGSVSRGIAVVTAETDDTEMKALHDAGVRGARIMDLPGGATPLSRLMEIDERAHAFGWCVAVQFDGTHLLDHAERLATIRSRWILDHHGKFFDGLKPNDPRIDTVKRLIDTGRCWFKFAGCYESSKSGPPDYEDVGKVAREIAAYAPERIVWGTNWPHNLIQETEDYPDDAAILDTVVGWIPEKHRRTVLVDNPAGLFDFG